MLIGTGVGSWRTMLSAVVGGVFMATIFNLFASDATIPFLGLNALWHMVIGSFAFGVVFMATRSIIVTRFEYIKNYLRIYDWRVDHYYSYH